MENLDFTAANVQSHTTIPGNMILHNVFHLEHIDPWKMFYILMAYVVGFRLVQYLLLAWQTDTLPWMLALVWCKRKHTDNLSVSISATEFTTPTGNDNSKTFCQFRLWPIHSSAVYPLRNDHNSNNNNGQLSSSSTVVMESIGSASSRRTGSGHIVSLPNDTEGHITAGMMTQQEQHDAPMPHNVTLGNNAEATMVVASSTPVEVPNNDNSSSNGNDAVGTAVSNNILVVDTADSVESFKKLPEEEEESRGVQ